MKDDDEDFDVITSRAMEVLGTERVTRATAAVCSATLSAIAAYADRVASSHRNLGTLRTDPEALMAVDVVSLSEMGAMQLRKYLRGEIPMEELLELCEGILRFEPPYPREGEP